MPDNTARFQPVAHRWIDGEARDLDFVERLVYRSSLLARDQRITYTGGGHTSSMLTETGPVTGGAIEALGVMASQAKSVAASIGTRAHYQASDDSATAFSRCAP